MGSFSQRNSISWGIYGWLVVFFFLPAPFAHAQAYLTRNYAIEEGLIQSQAAALYQDREGYLWIGTHGGISRFDGLYFKHFTVDEGLISNRTQALVQDAKDQLWAASTNGITIFTDSGFEYLTTAQGLLDNNINDLLLDSEGQMWIASQSGLSRHDGASFHHLTTSNGLINPIVNSIDEGPDKSIWSGTNGGLCSLKESTFRCYTTSDGLPHQVVNDILIDSNNRIWAATPAGIALLSTDGLDRFITREDLQLQNVNRLLEDSHGAIWVGTNLGVARLDHAGKLTNSWMDGNWIVRPLIEDREHNIWAGTSGRGVVKFQQTAFSHMNPILDLPRDVYLEVYEDRKGSIWAAGMTNGLFRIDSAGVEHFSVTEHPVFQHIRSIEEDDKGTLWIGTANGAVSFDGTSFNTYQTQGGRANNYIYAIKPDNKGQVWLGSQNGLNVLKGDSIKTIDLEFGSGRQTVFSFYEDDDLMWIGTSQGLMYYKNDRLQKVASLAERPISSIMPDPSGNLWLGTLGFGVYRFDPSSNQVRDTLNMSHGLNSSTVYFVELDGLNDLWIGTSKGVNNLDMEAYLMEDDRRIRAFGKEDGIVGVETNTDAAMVDQQGRLWFGTIDALIKYDASSWPQNDTPPPVQLAGVRLFLEPIDLADFQSESNPLVTFSHDKNHLTFDFIGLSYTAPEFVKYEYRLNGFDPDWQPATSSRFITYSNLPEGDYRFEVHALNNNGVRSNKPASVAFSVTPPFWKTSWFMLLGLSSLMLGIAGIVKLRTQSLNKRRIVLEQTVAERTEDLKKTHAELLEAREAALQAAKSKSAFMSAMTHELRTPMNGIVGMTQMLAITNMDEEQLDCTQTIMECSTMMMDLIENLLTFADLAAGQRAQKIERFKLAPFLDDTFTAVQSKSHGQVVETLYFLDKKIPEEIEADREHTRQILYHLLSNAIKFTQNGIVYLEVQLEKMQKTNQPETHLLFSVHDTGIGMEKQHLRKVFDAFTQADMSLARQFQGTGIGLALVNQLARLLAGELRAESWPGIGSSFYFSMPFNHVQEPLLLSSSIRLPLQGLSAGIQLTDKREARRLEILCRSFGMQASQDETTGQDVDVLIVDQTNAGKLDLLNDIVLNKQTLVLVEGIQEPASSKSVLPPGAPREEVERVLLSTLELEAVG